MGEKEEDHEHDHTDEEKKKLLTVVFKVEVHCEGCGSRITKAARGVTGVERVKVDCSKNLLCVIGEVDPAKLRDKLESKLKKKVELVSPLPAQKDDQKTEDKKPEEEKKSDENKPKEQQNAPAVTAVVLKMHLHCSGCIEKIHNILSKTEDVESISFDKQKDLVTVKGTSLDVESICDVLEKKMKRTVKIVPPKKSDGKDDGHNEKETAEKKVEAAGDGKKQAEFNRMMVMPMPMPTPTPTPMAAHPGYNYGYGYGYNIGPAYPSYPVQNLHAPQIFSDENPNACSVM